MLLLINSFLSVKCRYYCSGVTRKDGGWTTRDDTIQESDTLLKV